MVNNNTHEAYLNVVKDSSEQYRNYGVQGSQSQYNDTKQWQIVGKLQKWKYSKLFYTNQTENSNHFIMPLLNIQDDYSRWFKVILKRRDKPDKNKSGTFETDYTYDVIQWIEEVTGPQEQQAEPFKHAQQQRASQSANTSRQTDTQTFNQGQSTNVPPPAFEQDTTPSIIFQSLLKCAVTVVSKYPGNYQNADDMWANSMRVAYNSIEEAANPLAHRDQVNNFDQENNDIQNGINDWNQQ